MRKTERHRLILSTLNEQKFVGVEEVASKLETSQVTIRRDLAELASAGSLIRVHGGAELASGGRHALVGRSFERNVDRNIEAKKRIAARAAAMCNDGEVIIVDGGTTTYQMSPHLVGRGMQVLTNSLHIVQSMIADQATRLVVPGGEVFPEQNIVLSTTGDDGLANFRAGTMFMGAEALRTDGLRQSDSLLVHSEKRLLSLAERLIVLVDASKFKAQAGILLCPLSRIDTVITDRSVEPAMREALQQAGTQLVVAK